MSIGTFKRYLLPLLVLGLLAGLVIGFWSFLMTNIVEPVALLFWAVWRVVLSVDQNIYWAVLIVLCAILVIRLIPSENENNPNPAYHYNYKLPDRVEHWQALVEDFVLGKDEDEHLRADLKKLFVSVAELQERYDPMDLEKIHAMGKISLSTRAQRFLFPPKESGEVIRVNHLPLDLPSKWLRKWVGKLFRQDTILLNEILEWMEIEMEINHDK